GPTQIIAFVAEQISVARNVEAIWPATEIILVVQSLELARGADAEMVIHEIVAELTGGASKSTGPDVRRGAHQQPGRIERRSAKENDRRGVISRLISHSIGHTHSRRALLVLV